MTGSFVATTNDQMARTKQSRLQRKIVWEGEIVWSAKRVCSRWLMAALLSVPMILVGAQDRSRLSSNPKTSDVTSQPEKETNNTQRIENSGPGEPAGGRHAMDGWQTSEQFKNSPSSKWMADELGVSTAVADRLSVVFNFATFNLSSLAFGIGPMTTTRIYAGFPQCRRCVNRPQKYWKCLQTLYLLASTSAPL